MFALILRPNHLLRNKSPKNALLQPLKVSMRSLSILSYTSNTPFKSRDGRNSRKLNQSMHWRWQRLSIQPLSRAVMSTSSEKQKSLKRSNGANKTSLLTQGHENIYTIPNILSFTRLVAAPVVGYLLVHNHHAAALALFAYAGITDLIDGYIARKYKITTVLGTILDPAADKLLMTITVVCLALNGSLPVWLASLILGRDVGLGISAFYFRWISLPPPKTMGRFWDFSLPSAEVKPTGISKINTALQLLLVGSSIALPVIPVGLVESAQLDSVMTGLQYLVASTTVWSGLSYIFSKDAVKILTSEEVRQRISQRAAKTQKKP